jgi:CRISPR-associated protein Csd1
VQRDHHAFRDFHRKVLSESDDGALQAVLAFLEQWSPDQFAQPPLSGNPDILDANVVFRLDGEQRYVHEHEAAQSIWTRLLDQDAERARCLVTGEIGPLARLHPAIKGVQGAQTTGASIVSFNLSAFTSYGNAQGANAPVSKRAAFAYTTALNHLLRYSSDNHQRLQIGDTTTVFWAEADNPGEAAVAERLYAMLISPPDDAQESHKVGNVLEQAAQGRPLEEVDPQLHDGTCFYVLGLAPNASRLAVRFWYADTLGELARNLADHYRDLALDPKPWRTRPAVWRLLYETAAQRDAKNISPNLAGELMRAVITGRPYPRPLLATVVMRMRSDGKINGLRAALCKACLNRDYRLGIGNIQKEVPMSLDPNETAPGYRLGRLFAILEKVQSDAVGNVNAGIADRFYAAASATPASIFAMLLNKAKSHLGAVRRKKGEGLARHLEGQIGEIMDGLDPELPRSLPLEEQGRFAVGYYHQRQALYRKADEAGSDPSESGDE